MTKTIDCLEYSQWVSDLLVRSANLDLFAAEEDMALEEMRAYAKSAGMELSSSEWLMPQLNWYDMENHLHYVHIYGDLKDRPSMLPPPKPPARWLLRATWRLKSPN